MKTLKAIWNSRILNLLALLFAVSLVITMWTRITT